MKFQNQELTAQYAKTDLQLQQRAAFKAAAERVKKECAESKAVVEVDWKWPRTVTVGKVTVARQSKEAVQVQWSGPFEEWNEL